MASKETIDFGSHSVAESPASMDVRITSSALVGNLITAVSIAGDPDFSQTNDCVTLTWSGQCTISIAFAPSSEGPKTGTVHVTADSLVDGSGLDIPLRGHGRCEGIFIEPAVDWGPLPDNSGMVASFSPSRLTPGLMLPELASRCGYDHFTWHQVVLRDPYALILDPPQLRVPYVDPPLFPSRGLSFFGGEFLDSKPFYWNEENPRQSEAPIHLTDHTFSDLVGYQDSPTRPFSEIDGVIDFKTRLVGVLPGGSWDELYVFRWAVGSTGLGTALTTGDTQGVVLDFSEAPLGTFEPGELELLSGCRNCQLLFTDGFESGDLSEWAAPP